MDTICAIPTEYNGQKYRSRLEADVAMLLAKLGIAFEYEPTSFLMPNGQHYRPDFRWGMGTSRVQYLETRGYTKPSSDAQLEAFALMVIRGQLGEGVTFGIIRPAFDDAIVRHAMRDGGEVEWSNRGLLLHENTPGAWELRPIPELHSPYGIVLMLVDDTYVDALGGSQGFRVMDCREQPFDDQITAGEFIP